MQKPIYFIAITSVLFFSTVVSAEITKSKKTIGELEKSGFSTNYIIPIYSQILAARAPKGFHIDYENTTATKYIIEAVPKGETVNAWSQMFTITGYKGLASTPKLMPINLIQGTANGFKKACPSTFSAESLWKGVINGFDAFAAVLGCGISPTTSGKTSEMALIIAIKGEQDFYTIQFAERGSPSKIPLKIDKEKWGKLLKNMSPIKLCKKIAGEKPPYPSCIDK